MLQWVRVFYCTNVIYERYHHIDCCFYYTTGMGIILPFCLLVFPMAFILPISHIVRQVIVATAFMLVTVGVLGVIMGVKAYKILYVTAEDEQAEKKAKKAALHANDANELMYVSKQALLLGNKDANYEVCREQVAAWNAIMVNLALAHPSGSGSGSGSGATSSVAGSGDY